MLDLLHTLGIDPEKEAEAVDYGTDPDNPSAHFGNSWFHVIGHIIEGPTEPEGSFVPPDEKTGVTFTQRVALVPNSFGDGPVVQVEWFGEIPWALD